MFGIRIDGRGKLLAATAAGGAALATVALANAMAIGALSAMPFGAQALASGIVAALVAASLGAICASLVSRAPAEISGPPASMCIIYVALAADLIARGGPDAAPGDIVAALSLAVVLTGLLQVVAGCTPLGDIIKFLPYPVTAGFLSGTGILVIWSQLGTVLGIEGRLSGHDFAGLMAQVKPLAFLIAAAAAATVWLVPRLTHRIHPLLAGFLAGTVLYHLCGLAFDREALGPTLAPLAAASVGLERISAVAQRAGDVSWLAATSLAVLPYAALLALQGMLLSALASRAVADVTGRPPEVKRSLVGQGFGNMVSGVLAGLPFAALSAQSVNAARLGEARNSVPWASGLILLAAVLAFGDLFVYVPTLVLGALLVTVGVSLLDNWIGGLVLQAVRGADPRGEIKWNLAVVAAVAGTLVFAGVPLSLLVGVLLAMVILARSVSHATVFVCNDATRHPSRRVWPAEQEKRLASLRRYVRVLCPHGGLFFGTAERLARELGAVRAPTRYCIIDCSRLAVLDATGCRIIGAAARKLASCGIATLVAGFDPADPRDAALARLGLAAVDRNHWFADLDHALEWVESALLSEPSAPGDARVELRETELARGLSGDELDELRSHLRPAEADAGTVLFRSGAPGSSLYLIEDGLVEIRVDTDSGTSRRLAAIGPGCVFGEIAMLTTGARTADAMCVKPTRLYELRREALAALEPRAPSVYAKVMANLNRHLAVRLIAATELAREA